MRVLSYYGWVALGVAAIGMVATLIGSLFCVGIGRWLDRAGSRIVLTTIVLALGLAVDGDENPPPAAGVDATLGEALRSSAFYVLAACVALLAGAALIVRIPSGAMVAHAEGLSP